MTRPPTKHDDLDGARGLLTVFVCGLILAAVMFACNPWRQAYDDTIDRMVAAEHVVSRGLGGE